MRAVVAAPVIALLALGGGCLALVTFDGPAELGDQCHDGLDNDENGATDCDEVACQSECRVQARCGDGVVLPGVEECDDGNDRPDDGCEPGSCRFTCGSGVVADRRGYDPQTRHCYLGFVAPLDAIAANTMCLNLRGYLAVPDDAPEDALIRTIAPGPATLGLADNNPSANYEFLKITGNRGTEYLNFTAGQPDEPLDQLVICVSYDGAAPTWQDHGCLLPHPYVCELERNPCGDLVLEPGETCDDGNGAANDGCSAACVDEDECALGLDNCSVNAECFNAPWDPLYPGFTCRCLPGFVGDGVTCTPG